MFSQCAVQTNCNPFKGPFDYESFKSPSSVGPPWRKFYYTIQRGGSKDAEAEPELRILLGAVTEAGAAETFRLKPESELEPSKMENGFRKTYNKIS